MQQTQQLPVDLSQKSLAPRTVVVIGVGAGGPAALANIIPKLPASFAASIIVVQQMRPGFTRILAENLSDTSNAMVREAHNHEGLRSDQILIVPGCHTLTVMRTSHHDNPFIVNMEDHSDSLVRMRARIDATMKSAAETYSSRVIGVVLTGAGTDGRDGMKTIRDHGGATIAQDQDSSVLFDMPKAAIDIEAVDEILPLWNIADRLIDLIGDN
jgi:two-component system, chemotaxis family, protein-glutamate methylesterase/glutaminase